ncbi:MAG TPA: hypothetical protein VG347_21305 [Verrucomicrobiae bacterium]|nr:hypothetical protein [Verrucomicrobiae bacterium]
MKPHVRLLIKILAGGLGFVPALVLLTNMSVLPERGQGKIAVIMLLPAAGASSIANSLNVSKHEAITIFLATAFVWSFVLAWVCWQYAKLLLGEDELDGRPFDWTAWRWRFVIGFIPGFLYGWRFVRYSNGVTIIEFMVLTGVFTGLAFGAWRQNFWSRPF